MSSRRVGLEVDFIGPDIAEAVEVLKTVLEAEHEAISDHEHLLHSPLNDQPFRLEVDFEWFSWTCDMNTLEIHTQPIELCNVLKLHGMVSSGGMAKAEIAAGQVRVNGEIETRKRKKIVSGDVVEYGTETVRVVLQVQK